MCNDKRPTPSSRLETLPDVLLEQSRGSAEVTDGTEPSQGFPGQLEKLFTHAHRPVLKELSSAPGLHRNVCRPLLGISFPSCLLLLGLGLSSIGVIP